MYFYHGYALAVGSSTADNNFPAASCALPTTGGNAAAKSDKKEKFSAQGITFDYAESKISGTEVERNEVYGWITKASVVIENLKINIKVGNRAQELLSAKHVEAHIVSEHLSGDYEANIALAENRTRSRFEGLKIQGSDVTLDYNDDMFERYTTYSSLQADFKNKFTRGRVLGCLVGQGIPDAVGSTDAAGTGTLRPAYEAYQGQFTLPSLTSAVVCSCVKNVNGLAAGTGTWGPIIHLPPLGTIYLGEVIVWPWMRCLTMFRLELASGVRISGGSAGANGTTWPPGIFGGGGG